MTTLRSTARPKAFTGVIVSTVAIHFGITGVSPAFGRLAQLRRAMPSRRTPRATLPHETESEAEESVPTLAAWLTA